MWCPPEELFIAKKREEERTDNILLTSNVAITDKFLSVDSSALVAVSSLEVSAQRSRTDPIRAGQNGAIAAGAKAHVIRSQAAAAESWPPGHDHPSAAYVVAGDVEASAPAAQELPPRTLRDHAAAALLVVAVERGDVGATAVMVAVHCFSPAAAVSRAATAANRRARAAHLLERVDRFVPAALVPGPTITVHHVPFAAHVVGVLLVCLRSAALPQPLRPIRAYCAGAAARGFSLVHLECPSSVAATMRSVVVAGRTTAAIQAT